VPRLRIPGKSTSESKIKYIRVSNGPRINPRFVNQCCEDADILKAAIQSLTIKGNHGMRCVPKDDRTVLVMVWLRLVKRGRRKKITHIGGAGENESAIP
jgi:hypothetical protein